MRLSPGLFFLLLSLSNYGQTITGTISDAETGLPISGVNIYLANTTHGTTTDAEGLFELEVTENNLLIISHVSYEVQLIPAQAGLTIQLKPQTNSLDEVAITVKPDKIWKRNLKRFRREFFGESSWGRACAIENPWVLDFANEKNVFTASTNQLVKITNKKTGYLIRVYLEKFEQKNGDITISARPFFESINDNYAKIRETTFLGSKRHFLHALQFGDLKEEGFRVNQVKLVSSSQSFEVGKLMKAKDLIDEDMLTLGGYVEVKYMNEKMLGNQVVLRSQSASNFGKASASSQSGSVPQASYLLNLTERVKINEHGLVEKPNTLIDFGYWSTDERAGHWLPHDYFPASYLKRLASNRPQKSPQKKGGFMLSNLLIPLDEIHSGGPPKDGIPAILNPSFDTNPKLKDHDQILGLSMNGMTKAYPIKILNYHEVVNDQFGHQPVVITFCPLCGSGVGFHSSANSRKLTFGVSGLLYNSDVLLYDHQTESLWSQLMSKSVSGDHSNTNLEMITLTHTTWGEWKDQYPKSLVLSENTGFTRNYEASPYAQYLTNDRLMFSVSESNDALPKKALVLGVQVGDQFKAYPFSRLNPSDLTIDTFNGEEIRIDYDQTSDTAWLENTSSHVKSTRLFWFAWYAFHPETEIFEP